MCKRFMPNKNTFKPTNLPKHCPQHYALSLHFAVAAAALHISSNSLTIPSLSSPDRTEYYSFELFYLNVLVDHVYFHCAYPF